MGNFYAYIGIFLLACENQYPIDPKKHKPILAGTKVQLLSIGRSFMSSYFTFVGIEGRFPKTGKGWSPC